MDMTFLTFSTCQSRQCVNVSITDDTLKEQNESFTISLERSTGFDARITLDPSESTVIILNDDSKLFIKLAKNSVKLF